MAKKKYIVEENEVKEIDEITPIEKEEDKPRIKKGDWVVVNTRRDIHGNYFAAYYTYYDVIKVSEEGITIGKGKDTVATVHPSDIKTIK